MFINKKNKGLKLSVLALTSVAGVATLAAAATACATSQVSKDVATPIAKASTKMASSNSNGFYSYVTFENNAEMYPGLKFVGDTKVKVKTNYVFGAINPPTPVLSGYELDYWTVDGERITPDYVIEENITVLPVMRPATTGIILTGPDRIFDGIHLDKANGYQYSISIGGGVITTQPSWTVSAGLLDYEVATDNMSMHAIPLHSGEHSLRTVTITVSVGIGGQTFTDEMTVTIYPPYCSSDDVTLPGKTEPVNTGDVYWFEYTTGTTTTWRFALPETLCGGGTTEPSLIFYYLTAGTGGVEEYTSETITRTGTLTSYTTVCPGSYITSIPAYFMSNVTGFNAVLKPGVHRITRIGEGFLMGCTSFDQKMFVYQESGQTSPTDPGLFDPNQPIQIDNYFMVGCTSFNNGLTAGTDPYMLWLPNTQVIGDGFMNDCSSLYADVILHANSKYIGRNFISDCAKLNSIEISEDCLNLAFIGTAFCANDDGLAEIYVMTPDWNYFEDLSLANSASFTHAEEIATGDEIVVYLDTGASFDQFHALFPDKTDGPYRALVEPA